MSGKTKDGLGDLGQPRRQWTRSPLVHFLFIGGLLFAAQTWISGNRPTVELPEPSEGVILGDAQMLQLDRTWERRTGRRPSEMERAALVRQAIDEELLYKEALRLRLDEGNPSVRRRLITSMRFLSEGPTDEEDLYQEARELRLERSDPAVRQHLIGLMRTLARRSAMPESITETQIEDYYERHQNEFLQPTRLRLTHVYLSADRRGSRLEDDARSLLAQIDAENPRPDAAITLGDPFMLRSHFPGSSLREIERTFGAGFEAAVKNLAVGVWSEPISSGYGLHLVWVHERIPPQPRALVTVRDKVILGIEVERSEKRLATKLEELRNSNQAAVGPATHQPRTLVARGG